MSIFEKIAAREIPGFIIWENDTHCALLNIRPLSHGHTLVIPKTNIGDHLFELPKNAYTTLWDTAYLIAQHLQTKLNVPRIISLVEGLEVPHVHIHLIPAVDGFSMASSVATPATNEQLSELHQQLLLTE